MITKIYCLMTDYNMIKMMVAIVGWAMAFVIEFARPHFPSYAQQSNGAYFSNYAYKSERYYLAPSNAYNPQVYWPNWDYWDQTPYFSTRDLRW